MACLSIRRSELKPVERAAGSKWVATVAFALSPSSGHVAFARRQRESHVIAQGVVVVEILVASDQPHYALGEEFLNAVLDESRVAVVRKTGSHPLGQPELNIGFPYQQEAAVRCDPTRIEISFDLTRKRGLELELLATTDCFHRTVLSRLCQEPVSCWISRRKHWSGPKNSRRFPFFGELCGLDARARFGSAKQ